MDQPHTKDGRRNHELVDLDELGKKINLSFNQEKLRSFECPKCHKLYIRNHKKEIKYVKCVCAVNIELKKRWFDA
jgi:hypothetical protein